MNFPCSEKQPMTIRFMVPLPAGMVTRSSSEKPAADVAVSLGCGGGSK